VTDAASNFEALLREALAPVEPPEDLIVRLESTLESITEMAAGELQEWELSAMRDPRNWARPAAALLAGTAAATALVILRARRRTPEPPTPPPGGLAGARAAADRARRALHDLSRDTRRLLGER
jgi:hypothetical protein